MISFYLIWGLGYLALLFWLSQKWPDSPFPGSDSTQSLPVTLIIPFRNEAANAEKLISSLSELSSSTIEILLVDDHSEDGSLVLFQSLVKGHKHIQVLQSPGVGKKAALDFAISTAKSELILTSDADCVFQSGWVDQMRAPFSDPEIQLVSGPVVSAASPKSLFASFQQLEWCSILLLTQFGFAQRNPLMCSGANLAFRKSAFEAVKGYEGNAHFLSGDDEFLLKKIVMRFGSKSSKYLPFSEALVTTSAQDSWRSLIRQRIRWAGKWKLHRDWLHSFAAILAFLSQWVWLGSWVVVCFFSYPVALLLMVFSLKIVAEKLALGKVAKHLGVKIAPWTFLFTSLAHPVYVVLVAIGSWSGNVTWKGRKSRI